MSDSIGVVVPTYNCREYLSECIDSVLSQSYAPTKIVICDDYSQDGTQELILDYQRNNPNIIEAILHEKNIGIPRNFNSGLRKINTDYVSIVSGDDLWHKDKLKLELEALKENPDCQWAYSNSSLVDKDGNFISAFQRKHDGAEGQIIYEVLTHQMTLRNWLIQKPLLDKVGLFDEKLPIFEDWDFKIRLAIAASIAHVDHYSIYYRRYGKGISESSGDIYFENLLKIYIKHKGLIKTLPQARRSRIKKYQLSDMIHHVNRYLNSCKLEAKYKCIKFYAIKYLLMLADKVS